MRQRTKRKYYARSNVAQTLKTAVIELQSAIDLADKPPTDSPMVEALKRVLAAINRAIENERIYQLGRKRIKADLEKEKRNLEVLIEQVVGVPVTDEEKVMAKTEKLKRQIKVPKESKKRVRHDSDTGTNK